jgi:hypothetical protein
MPKTKSFWKALNANFRHHGISEFKNQRRRRFSKP